MIWNLRHLNQLKQTDSQLYTKDEMKVKRFNKESVLEASKKKNI